MSRQIDRLRGRLAQRSAIIVPGAGNALAARIIADLGFEAVYLSGAGLTNTLLGLPDLAFVSLPELVQNTAAISEITDLPLIVDADTGFGNAINVRQTVRALERAGANAIQLEDQVSPKKCGHFSGKAVIDVEEMCGKVKAAVEGRRSGGWVGLGAPAKTPPEVIAVLHNQVNAALADPAFKAQLVKLSLDPFVTSQADFAKFIVDFTEKWRNVIRTANIKPE